MFFRKNRRSGVTLAEAMIMVIVAGSLMIPVIGTLQQGVERTSSLELRSALQNYAESKMAEITYYCLREGQIPTNSVEGMAYPNETNPEYKFSLRIEVLTDPALVTDNASFSGHIHKDFTAVSLVASIAEAVDGVVPATETVSLMSMMCPPPPPPDYVYAAHPATNKIAIINPMVPDLITEIPVAPEIPMQLAVHPNGKYLAIKCPDKILMMDLVSHAFVQVYADTALCGNTVAETGEGANGARQDRGIVFRPDGKYIYFTRHNPMSVVILKPTGTPTDPWNYSTHIGLNSNLAHDMRLLDDGTLVVADGSSANNRVYRINTHSNTLIETFAGGADPSTSTNVQLAMAGEWGGNNFFARMGNNRVTRLGTHAPTDFITGQIGGSFDEFTDARSHSLLTSFDNRWLFAAAAYNSTGASTQRIAALKVSTTAIELTTTTNSRLVTRGNTGGDSARPISQIEYSPYREQIILKTTDNKLMFPSISALTAGSYSLVNDITAFLTLNSGIADVKGRLAEYAWVMCSDGVASHSIECIDIYSDINTSLSDNIISLAQQPMGIGVNAGGNIGVYSFQQTGAAPKKIQVADHSVAAFPNALNFPALGRAAKTAFLLDGSLLVLSEKNDCDCHKTGDFYPGMGLTWDDMHNGFLLYEADADGNPAATACLGFAARAESGGTGFKVRDLAVMHRRSGAYVLMSREDQTDSILLWIEKSRAPGYTPQTATESYRIMGYWRTLFDGFPTKSARKIALSADDTLLAIYDNQGNGTNQAIYFYDLTNNHFPTTAGFTYNRYYTSTSVPNPGAIPNNYYGTQYNSNFPTSAVAPLKPANILTASSTFVSDANFNPRYPLDFDPAINNNDDMFIAFNGYFYHDSQASFIGFATSDGSRIAKAGYYPYRASRDGPSVREPWYDSVSETHYFSYDYLTGSGSGPVQIDYFSNDTGMGSADFGVSNFSTDFTSANWSSVTHPPAQMFRPFKFKPFLIHELKMDGADATYYTAALLAPTATDDLVICFSRDSSVPTLFFATTAAPALYAYDLYEEKFKKSDTNKLAENLTTYLFQISDMQISPDGFRLLISGRDASNIGKVLMMNLACGPGTPGQLADAISWKVVTTENPPRAIAVRPFSGHSSIRDIYPTTITSGAVPMAGFGSHRAAVADGGIHVFGGAPGVEDDADNDRIIRIKPDANVDLITAASMTNKLKDIAAVPFDDNKILILGGEAPGSEPQSSVSVYDAKKQTFVQDGFAAMASDSNEISKLRRHAAAATPYGPIILGGFKGDTTTSIVDINSSGGWATVVGAPNQDGTISDPFLVLGAGAGGSYGSAYSNQITLTPITSFHTSFKTSFEGRDGATFVVQNNSATAIGGNNKNLGYTGINNSVAVWIDNHTNNLEASDCVMVAKNGVYPCDPSLPTAYHAFSGDTLGSNETASADYYWWVNYDGQRDMLNVWAGSTNNPETADWVIKDCPIDLLTELGGSTAWFGFTGGNNDDGGGTGFIKISDWKLTIWEKEAYGAALYDDGYQSYGSPPWSGISHNGSPTPNQNDGMIRVADNSNYERGAVWRTTPIDLTTLGSFRCTFAVAMWSLGENGMAFIIQSSGNNLAPSATTSSLGYGGFTNSVAVEFDTYDSGTNDPDDNHVAIIKDGNATGVHDNYTSPSWDMDQDSNQMNYFWVEYDAPSRNLRVYGVGGDKSIPYPGKPTSPIINHVFSTSLETILGNTQAWIGFVARCGNSSPQEHYLARWKYEQTDLAATVGGITDEVKTYLPNTISGSIDDVQSLLTLVSNATYLNNAIRLVDNTPSVKGAVWSKNAVQVTNDSCFSTHFVMRFDQFSNFAASPKELCDGIAFIIQGGADNLIGDDAYFIGYGGPGSTIGNSFGVELDVVNNSAHLAFTESDGNHMAAVINGDAENERTPRATNPNGVNLFDEKETHIWIDYDGPTRTIKGYASKTHIKPGSAALTYQYNVGEEMFNLIGGNARFGLTSSNGSWNSEAWIQSWELIVDNKMLIQFPPRGETLATTNLPAAMANGTAVTHYSRKDGKYYLYYIGGGTDYGTQVADMIWRFNFDDATWSKKDVATSTSTKINIDFAGPNGASQVNTRTQVAACSWGDEIFIFGGCYSNSPTTYAIAYNPDTGRYRNIAGLSTAKVSMSAVPYGPYIFLIGGSANYNGTTGADYVILRYKP